MPEAIKHVQLRPEYFVSLYWVEKAWLLFDYFQIHGLLWVSANKWPWPYYWVRYTSSAVLVNLDFFSRTEDGALFGQSSRVDISPWGQMESYTWTYAVWFALAPVLLGVFYVAGSTYLTAYGRSLYNVVHYLEVVCLSCAAVLYVPCTLAVVRLYHCQDGLLSVEPAVQCGSSSHVWSALILSLMVAPLVVGLPLYTARSIRDVTIYRRSAEDHEKRLQAWEIGYTLGIDMNFSESNVYLCSSFTLPGAYFRVEMTALKLSLLVLFVAARWNTGMQASLMLLCLLYFHCRVLWHTHLHGPFRKSSSNRIFLLLGTMTCVNSTFGMMNAFQVENAVMVASIENLILFGINLSGFALIVLVTVLAVLPRAHCLHSLMRCFCCGADLTDDSYGLWPSHATLRRISCSSHGAEMAGIVDDLQDAYAVFRGCATAPPEVADVLSLEECIQGLQRSWLKTRRWGSIFQLVISDILEECLLVQARLRPVALRYRPRWDTEYHTSRKRLQQRDGRYALMTGRKRRILMKLLAVSSFKGDKQVDLIDFVPNATMHEISNMNERIEEETGNSERLLTKTDPGHPLMLLGADADDAYLQSVGRAIDAALEFWQRVVGMYEGKLLPGWERFASGHIENWYVLREALLTRSEELKYTAYADTESRGSQQGSWQGSQQGSWQGSQPEDGEGSGGDGDHVPLLAQLSAIAESEREFGDSPRRSARASEEVDGDLAGGTLAPSSLDHPHQHHQHQHGHFAPLAETPVASDAPGSTTIGRDASHRQSIGAWDGDSDEESL